MSLFDFSPHITPSSTPRVNPPVGEKTCRDIFFNYWQVSSSLWEERLGHFSSGETVVLPVVWAYMAGKETEEVQKIIKVSKLAFQMGLRPIIGVAIGGLPGVVNGALPPELALCKAVDSTGMPRGNIGTDNQVHFHYSIFSPGVFKAFRKFTALVASNFLKQGLSFPVIGLEFDKGLFTEDRSSHFYEGHKKILDIKEGDLSENSYAKMIQELYQEGIRSSFDSWWEGHFIVDLLGDGALASMRRHFSLASKSDMILRSTESLKAGELLALGLLSESDIGPKALQWCQQGLQSVFQGPRQTDFNQDTQLATLYGDVICVKGSLSETNLSLLRPLVGGSILYKSLEELSNEGSTFTSGPNSRLVIAATNEETTAKEYIRLIRTSMKGLHVLLIDHSQKGDRIFGRFLAENSLSSQKLKAQGEIEWVELGQSSVVKVNGKQLSALGPASANAFWARLIKLFSLPRVEIHQGQGIATLWEGRTPLGNELDFAFIKMAKMFNTTSYKQKLKLSFAKELAFLGATPDVLGLKVRPGALDLELLPGESVELSWGQQWEES